MAFGLIHWLMSFAIFFVVLAVITWSAVHLGQKQDYELPMMRFLDIDDYPNRRKHGSLNSTINITTVSPVTESTDNTTLFADHQGIGVSDSAQFYKMLQVISLMEKRDSTQNDIATTTATVASSIVTDSAWNEDKDVTVAVYNTESAKIDHHWSTDKEMMKSSTQQAAHSTISPEHRMFAGTTSLRKFDSYPPDKTGFSSLPRNKGNGTLRNASAAFQFVQLLPGAKQTSTTKHSEDERFEIEASTIPTYFYAIIYTTEDP